MRVMRSVRPTKYKAQPTRVDGLRFASHKEERRGWGGLFSREFCGWWAAMLASPLTLGRDHGNKG